MSQIISCSILLQSSRDKFSKAESLFVCTDIALNIKPSPEGRARYVNAAKDKKKSSKSQKVRECTLSSGMRTTICTDQFTSVLNGVPRAIGVFAPIRGPGKARGKLEVPKYWSSTAVKLVAIYNRREQGRS